MQRYSQQLETASLQSFSSQREIDELKENHQHDIAYLKRKHRETLDESLNSQQSTVYDKKSQNKSSPLSRVSSATQLSSSKLKNSFDRKNNFDYPQNFKETS